MNKNLKLPKLYHLEQHFQSNRIEDITGTIKYELAKLSLEKKIKPGHTVAISAGSRGIRHMDAIRKDGLKIDGVRGTFVSKINVAEKLDFNPDIVFISVKTQDVETVCHEIKSRVKNVPIVLMQNGITSVRIAGSIFGKENIISSVLLLNAQYLSPGEVTYVADKPIILQNVIGKKNGQIQKIQSLLNSVAKTELTNNIYGIQWTKLFINAMGNSLDAMTGMALGEYRKFKSIRKIGILILKETFSVVKKAGINLESLPGFPLRFFKIMIAMPMPIASYILKIAMNPQKNADIITSTLQSIKRGKKTEIDFINGEIVALGKQIGIKTPVNKKVVQVIHEIEDTKQFYSPDKLARLFLSQR